MIEFKCKCGKKFSVEDKYAGKKGKCPQCKEVVRIPPQSNIAQDKDAIKSSKDNLNVSDSSVSNNKADLDDFMDSIGIANNNSEGNNQNVESPIKFQEPTKACPYCGEEILEIAKKCKHCKEYVESSEGAFLSLNGVPYTGLNEGGSKSIRAEGEEYSQSIGGSILKFLIVFGSVLLIIFLSCNSGVDEKKTVREIIEKVVGEDHVEYVKSGNHIKVQRSLDYSMWAYDYNKNQTSYDPYDLSETTFEILKNLYESNIVYETITLEVIRDYGDTDKYGNHTTDNKIAFRLKYLYSDVISINWDNYSYFDIFDLAVDDDKWLDNDFHKLYLRYRWGWKYLLY